MDELRKELLTLGYPHNFQHGERHTVDYLYRLSDIYRRHLNPDDSDDIESHSELRIYQGCLELMRQIYDEMVGFMKIQGFDISMDSFEDNCPISIFHEAVIVRTLFLSGTNHAGGSSTNKKCAELGLHCDFVTFYPEEDEESE